MVVTVSGGGGITYADAAKLHWQGHERSKGVRLVRVCVEESRHEGAGDGVFDGHKLIIYTAGHSLQMNPFTLQRLLEAYEGTMGRGAGNNG